MSLNKPEFTPSFGRIHSRHIKSSQKDLIDNLLPELLVHENIKSLPEFFGGGYKKYYLEIGFGAGEHILNNAIKNPDIGFVGCEVFDKGVGQVLQKISQDKLKNIRLYNKDVRLILEKLPKNSFDKIYILFPDPWPKKRHNRRRIINQEMLTFLHRLLKPDGVLRIASDWADYIRWIMVNVNASGKFNWLANSNSDWQQPVDHFITRYQTKAIKEGRKSYFLEFSKT